MNIHACCCIGNLTEVRRILATGIDINLKNYNGMTPLHLASKSGYLNIVRELIKQGANVNLKAISGRAQEGYTALYMAVQLSNNPEIVKELIRNGANINERCIVGMTALHGAAMCCNLEMVRLLLQYSDLIDFSIKDDSGRVASDYTNTTAEIKNLIIEAFEDQQNPLRLKEPDC